MRMALALALLLAPVMTNGATLILERVPNALVDTIRYRYYYADNGTGPFIEGTATIDNLVIAGPEPATGAKGHMIDTGLEGGSSEKAESQVLATPLPLVSPLQQSPGCLAKIF